MVILDERASCNQKESTESYSSEACKNQSNSLSFCEARVSAFNTLALWSGTAWTSTKERSSINSMAQSEWVHHQRIWMAVDKVTIAEIIGSVRGVIPSSRLASYGDFRYDLDLEEMYDVLGDVNAFSFINECCSAASKDQNLKTSNQVAKNLESYENNGKEYLLEDTLLQKNISINDEKDLKNFNLQMNYSGFEEWISKCQTFLRIVRCIVAQENAFDVWSEVLLKTCSKFLSALRCNASLLKVMEADVPLITDYRQLLTEPITILEVLSLPQPYLDDNLDLDIEQEDTFWLKLSSPSIKKLWEKKQNGRQEKEPSKNSDSASSDSWLGTTNFLRRQRQKKPTATSKEEIEIPETEARHLLGSLFNIIDCHDDLKIVTNEAENKSDVPTTSKIKNYFPEAHGEWTRTLFPRRVNAQNETNANAPFNGSNYFQHQIDRQVFYKPIMPPPVNFPPPLYVPPPSLYSQSSQRLPFYLPSHTSNQPLQNYNYDKVHSSLPLNYVISPRSLATDNQQFLATVPSISLQHSAGAGLHVQQVSRYYSHSLSNSPLQANVSRVLQAKQRCVIQENVLTMKSTQLYQRHLASMDKNATQHNENFIKEVMKSKLLPNTSSRISAESKLPLQAQELHQRHSGYPFQPTVNSVKNTKSDFSSVQNTLVCCPQSVMPTMSRTVYNTAKFINLKQYLGGTSEAKKVEANVPTQHKRAPLVLYNHQRSPIIEKLRRDLPSTFLFKKDISYNRQKVLTEKLHQTMILNAENKTQKNSKKYLLTLNQSENGINDNYFEFGDDSERFSSRNKSFRNILLENRNKLSIFDNALADDEGNYSNSYNDVKINQISGKLMFNAKLKLMAKKKKMIKRCIRFDPNKIMLLLYKNMKTHGNISSMDSIYKWIWDSIKLHKKNSCLLKRFLEANQYSILLKYRNKKFGFRMYKNDCKRALKILKNINSIRQLHVNGSHRAISYILYLKTACNKNNDLFKDDWQTNEIYDQTLKNVNLDQYYKMNSNRQNIKKCIENKNCLNAEFLNSMAENLFFSDEITTSRPTSFKREKINGWTYFKIAIQIIMRKASKILMNKNTTNNS